MSKKIETTLTDIDYLAIESEQADPSVWMANTVSVYANKKRKIIIEKNTEHCNANSVQLAVGEDAQIQQAFDLGVVEKASESTKDDGKPGE